MKSFIIILFFPLLMAAQSYNVKGKLFDKETNEPLSFASIRIDGTTTGTASNLDGEFTFRFKRGNYKLIFSYVGYKSDTIEIKVPRNSPIVYSLEPQTIKLGEVLVIADEDPAYSIIREAIKRKKINRLGLQNFEYSAYAKRIMLSNGEVALIQETFVKGYNKPNHWEKEFILSSHKTENADKDMNMSFKVNDSYYIDFSSDTLTLMQSLVYLPIADNAFDHYDYKLLQTTIDNEKEIYLIQVIPNSKIQPLLEGTITIDSDKFALNSIELKTNKGVRFPYVNDFEIKFRQQLGLYEGYYLPNFVEMNSNFEINFGGLLKIDPISFNQVNSISDYKINIAIPDSIENAEYHTGGAYTTDTSGNKDEIVELSRNEIDSLRSIPLTQNEQIAYSTLDSTKTLNKIIKPKGALAAFIPDDDDYDDSDTSNSILGSLLNHSTTYIGFRNNRVNGITLGLKYNDYLYESLSTNSSILYTLQRERVETKLNLNYRIRKSFFNRISAGYFNYSKSWNSLSFYSDLVNSVVVTLGLDDQFNYYHAHGFGFNINMDLYKTSSFSVGFISEQQKSLVQNNLHNVFKSTRNLRENPAITEGRDTKFNLTIQTDHDPLSLQVIPESGVIGQFEISNPAMGSDFNYKKLRVITVLKSKTFYDELFISPYLHIAVDAALLTGEYGKQHLLTSNNGINFFSPFGTFKGVLPYEFIGDKMVSLHVEHNWRTILFQSLGLDFLTDMHLDIITGASGLKIWNESKYSFSQKNKDYWETYIGVSRIFGLLRFDVAYNSHKDVMVRGAVAVIL